MSDYKTATSIVVLGASPKSPNSVNVFKASRQNTSAIPELAGLTTSDSAMHTLGTNMSSEYVKFKASPPKSTKALDRRRRSESIRTSTFAQACPLRVPGRFHGTRDTPADPVDRQTREKH